MWLKAQLSTKLMESRRRPSRRQGRRGIRGDAGRGPQLEKCELDAASEGYRFPTRASRSKPMLPERVLEDGGLDSLGVPSARALKPQQSTFA